MRRFSGASAILASLLLLTGCLERLEPVGPLVDPLSIEQENIQRDSVLAVVEAMDRSALDSAFHRLADHAYVRQTDVRQLDRAGGVVASLRRTERFSGPRESRQRNLISADSTGAFEDGMMGRFSQTGISEEEGNEPGRLILADDPPFLSGRGREAYRFRVLPDSTSDGRSFLRLLVELRPEESDAQNLRRVRLILERESGLLVAADVLVSQHSMLYQERSHFELRLSQTIDGKWLPERMLVDSHVGSTVFDPRRYRIETTFQIADS